MEGTEQCQHVAGGGGGEGVGVGGGDPPLISCYLLRYLLCQQDLFQYLAAKVKPMLTKFSCSQPYESENQCHGSEPLLQEAA